jgi:hypothetical protein
MNVQANNRSLPNALLDHSLRLLIVGTISVIALISLIFCYQGIFELITFDFADAAMKLGWGTTCGIGSLLLIRYRGDLIDD